MTIYEKNLNVLTKFYPEMDILIENAKKDLEAELEIFEEESLEGEPILKIHKDNRICYLNGKRNTREPAKIWVQTLGELEQNAPILMFGIGNHTYLEELVEQTEKRLAIIVCEPSLQIFLKFLEMVDIEPWMEKHLIVFWVDGIDGMDEKHMRGMIGNVLTYEMLNFSRNFILPNYEMLFPEEAVNFMQICRDVALGETTQYLTRKRYIGVTVKNLLYNARFLPKGYKTTQLMEVIPQNIPGIVVAAGPSLNKNMEQLKKAKGKAFIIAVDTAIKPLLKAGIVPDMFAIVDALKPLDLVQIEEARNIPLVTTLNAASEVLEYHTGMKFFYNEGFQFAERIFLKTGQPIGDVESGGSVATSAFSLLYKIGLNPIILVGQDLAFTDNKSHADGTFKEVMEEEDTSHFIMVEGNCGEKVPTRADFKLYLEWYNSYIKGCKEYDEDFRVINATEGGAKIEGTECMTLEEAIEQECTQEIDIQECLAKLFPMLSEENQAWSKEYLWDLPKAFRKLSVDAVKIKKLYQKLDEVCDKKSIDSKEYLSVLKKLKKQIKNIEKTSAYQLAAITLNEAQSILRNEQFLSEDSLQAEGKEIARKGILYMENVKKAAELFEELSLEVFV